MTQRSVCGYIPQDFNLDIETTGKITGINPGHTKLVSLEINLLSKFNSIMCRKARGDNITLTAENGAVNYTSSLES